MVCVGGTLRCLVLIRWFALLITGLLLSTWYDDPPFVTLLIPSCYSLVLYGPVTLFLSTRGDTHTCVLCQTTSKAIREVVGVCFWKNIDIVCNGHRLLKWWIGWADKILVCCDQLNIPSEESNRIPRHHDVWWISKRIILFKATFPAIFIVTCMLLPVPAHLLSPSVPIDRSWYLVIFSMLLPSLREIHTTYIPKVGAWLIERSYERFAIQVFHKYNLSSKDGNV